MQALDMTPGPAAVLQQLQLEALQSLSAGDRARVEDLCPSICLRDELEKFIQDPPSAWWGGYATACLAMRAEIAALTGRAF